MKLPAFSLILNQFICMRHQLKCFLIVGLILLGLTPVKGQICTPDTQFDSLGLFPGVLPPGVVGEAYNSIATAVITDSVVVPQFNNTVFAICQGTITKTIPDLADVGLSYECDVADCIINIDQTDMDSVTRACLVISGTPTAPLDSIQVELTAVVGNCGVAGGTLEFKDTLTVSLEITQSTSLLSLADRGFTLRSYQASESQLLVGVQRPQSSAAATLSVVNVQGRRMTEVFLPANQAVRHVEELNVSNWPAGVYLLRLAVDGEPGILTHKAIIQR